MGNSQAHSITPPSPTGGEASPASTPPKAMQNKNGGSYIISRKNHGDAAPDFIFQNAQGQDATLGQFSGRPILVNLWATWCAPCLTEMPELDHLAGRYAGKLTVLTISQDSEKPEKVIALFKTHGYKTIRPWLEPENQFSFHYNTGLLPTSILYDADGTEVARVVGALDWNGPVADALIEEAINGS